MTNCHKAKDKDRNDIESQIKEFFMRGGEIEQVQSDQIECKSYKPVRVSEH